MEIFLAVKTLQAAMKSALPHSPIRRAPATHLRPAAFPHPPAYCGSTRSSKVFPKQARSKNTNLPISGCCHLVVGGQLQRVDHSQDFAGNKTVCWGMNVTLIRPRWKAGLPIWLLKPDKICFFLAFFQSERLGYGKKISELHLHFKSLLKMSLWSCRVHSILQRLYCCPEMIDAIDKKQMYVSVITGKENTSKNWNCTISLFLASFNVHFVFGYPCFMCICLKTAIWLCFGTKSGFFWWRQAGNPSGEKTSTIRNSC